jgi:hypothetical protein
LQSGTSTTDVFPVNLDSVDEIITPKDFDSLKLSIHSSLLTCFGVAYMDIEEFEDLFFWISQNIDNSCQITNNFHYHKLHFRNGCEEDEITVEILASINKYNLVIEEKSHGEIYGVTDF